MSTNFEYYNILDGKIYLVEKVDWPESFAIAFVFGSKHVSVPDFIKLSQKLWSVLYKKTGRTDGRIGLDRFGKWF